MNTAIRHRYQIANPVKVCEVCGKTFGPNQWDFQAKWDRRIVCSQACGRIRTAEHRRIHQERACLQCGKMFRPKRPAKGRTTMFCSRTCYWASKKGKPTPHRPMPLPRIERKCEGCTAIMRLLPHQVRKGRRFCSRTCWLAFMHERAPREPAEHSAFYRTPLWKALRNYVRLRDNLTCQDCGAQRSRRKLTVHHVKPRATFTRPEDADHPDNLTTVCYRCHQIAHYGQPLRKTDCADI